MIRINKKYNQFFLVISSFLSSKFWSVTLFELGHITRSAELLQMFQPAHFLALLVLDVSPGGVKGLKN
jgi:hypothetical protein